MSADQIHDRVRELVANLEAQARKTRSAIRAVQSTRGLTTKAALTDFAADMAHVTVEQAKELAELLAAAKLEVQTNGTY